MKNKTFLAINLNQFHENQEKDCAWTNVQIRFISAKDIESARQFVKEYYPTVAWVVIPKQYFDRNIVYRSNFAVNNTKYIDTNKTL